MIFLRMEENKIVWKKNLKISTNFNEFYEHLTEFVKDKYKIQNFELLPNPDVLIKEIQHSLKFTFGKKAIIREIDNKRNKVELYDNYAKKIYRKSRNGSLDFYKELKILTELNSIDVKSNYFVRVLDGSFNPDDSAPCILYLEKGKMSLEDDITAKIDQEYFNNKTTIEEISKVFENINHLVQGVKKMHEKGYLHMDLKPGNFIWVKDKLKVI